jgi:hypothetical protein
MPKGKGTYGTTQGRPPKKIKKMNRGGLTLDPMSRKKSFIDSKDSGLRNVGTQAERDLGLRLHKGPGMKAGKKVKMNMGMQVPTYNDVVRRKTGGKV